jgi:hypothetical protein
MYLGNDYLKEFIIGGGLQTASHKKSGGYRLDIVHTPGINRAWFDYEKILEAPNGDGTNYAVFRLVGTEIYKFAVHIKNARSAKRGELAFDLVSGKYLHVHFKIGGYSSLDSKYLHYLEHLDPTIKISTNYGSNAYTGLNKGAHVPGTSNSNPLSMAIPKETIDFVRIFLPEFNQGANLTHPTDAGLESWIGVSGIKEFITEIQNYRILVGTLNDTIKTLNASIGGLTTDRNKYREMANNSAQEIIGYLGDITKLKDDLKELNETLVEKNRLLLEQEQQMNNFGEYKKQVNQLDVQKTSTIKTLNQRIIDISKAYERCLDEKQGGFEDYKKVLIKLYRSIKALFFKHIYESLRKLPEAVSKIVKDKTGRRT